MGQGGVGKTAMVVRFQHNDFIEGYMPTIGDMYTTDVESPMGPRHCEIDDTAGQVRRFATRGALPPVRPVTQHAALTRPPPPSPPLSPAPPPHLLARRRRRTRT